MIRLLNIRYDVLWLKRDRLIWTRLRDARSRLKDISDKGPLVYDYKHRECTIHSSFFFLFFLSFHFSFFLSFFLSVCLSICCPACIYNFISICCPVFLYLGFFVSYFLSVWMIVFPSPYGLTQEVVFHLPQNRRNFMSFIFVYFSLFHSKYLS